MSPTGGPNAMLFVCAKTTDGGEIQVIIGVNACFTIQAKAIAENKKNTQKERLIFPPRRRNSAKNFFFLSFRDINFVPKMLLPLMRPFFVIAGWERQSFFFGIARNLSNSKKVLSKTKHFNYFSHGAKLSGGWQWQHFSSFLRFLPVILWWLWKSLNKYHKERNWQSGIAEIFVVVGERKTRWRLIPGLKTRLKVGLRLRLECFNFSIRD